MNALTKQFKDRAISTSRMTVIMNAASISAGDKILALISDEGSTLQEFLEVLDVYEDENIAEGKSFRKANKTKAAVDESDLPEGLAELETLIRSMREPSKDKDKIDFDDANAKAEMECRGVAKAIKTALGATKEISDKRFQVDGADLYGNWKRYVGDSLQAWVRVWAKEHAACQARLEQLAKES